MTTDETPMEALLRIRSEMTSDHRKALDDWFNKVFDPPAELTELAAKIAVGTIPGKRGDAGALLDSWNAQVESHGEARALLMASWMGMVRLLLYLQDEGWLHRHTNKEDPA